MARARTSETLKWPVILALDFVTFIFSLLPGLISWSLTITMITHFFSTPLFFVSLLFSPIVLLLSYLIIIFVFRLLIPKLKPGVFSAGFNKGMVTWSLHLSLRRSQELSGLKPIIFSFYLTKFLFWRALGAHIDYRVTTSLNISIVDLPLITIGKGSTISEGTHIAAHSFVGDKLFLAPVVLGENVFLGMNCVLGAKTNIGDGSWIGFQNIINGETLPPQTKLDNWERAMGKPKPPSDPTNTQGTPS